MSDLAHHSRPQILPNVLAPIIVITGPRSWVANPRSLTESALSFLGLGRSQRHELGPR